jgi:hypothetical protein
MKKTILTTLLLTLTSTLALTPTAPVVRVDDNGAIVERRQSLPIRYAGTYPYHSASYRWESDGWRAATITSVTTTNVVEIPQAIQTVAAAYKTAIESIYGEGAATNTALTRAAVAIDLSLREDISADVGLRLSTWFEILDGYWQRGEIWSFPWEESSYQVSSTVNNWEVVTDE